MKKITAVLLLVLVVGYFFFTRDGKVIKNTALSYVVPTGHLHEDGMTVMDRILVPEGYERSTYAPGSFQSYLQTYPLKEFGAKVVNYDGNDYVYQSGHVGVLEVPVPSNGLQQCADALIRIRSEYLWEQDRKDEIGFNFTSGHYCSWSRYAAGYRPRVSGSQVTFSKTASANASQQNFYKYLNLIYTYSGTQSLYDELPAVTSVDEIEVGDMLIKPGSPGHVIMVVDKATGANGEKLFIFAQGNTPAQSVHVLKNPNDASLSPWYEIEMNTMLEIPTYYFDDVKFMRFK
ncbi:MAG: DUF4846 domain-containing protein [Bacteroidota bacterium]